MFPELITELLQDGYKVNFIAPGHSMYPTIMANETIVVEPIDPGTVRQGDIILYRTNGRVIAHRVIGIEKEIKSDIAALHYRSEGVQPEQRPSSAALHFIFRGDAAPSCDQPVKAEQILGKVISIERHGCNIDPYSFKHKIGCLVLTWKARLNRLLN
jgi:signal peptidase I